MPLFVLLSSALPLMIFSVLQFSGIFHAPKKSMVNAFVAANILLVVCALPSLSPHALKSWLKLSAPLNISSIFLTFETFHLCNGLLNAFAFINILCIFSTFATFQWFISWLKFSAPQNIRQVHFTLSITHFSPKGCPPLLKLLAWQNIPIIPSALLVFHFAPMGWLKLLAFQNIK